MIFGYYLNWFAITFFAFLAVLTPNAQGAVGLIGYMVCMMLSQILEQLKLNKKHSH